MDLRRQAVFGAMLLVFGGLGVLVAVSVKQAAQTGAEKAKGPAAPELILRGVEMQEVRKTGSPYRLYSEQASYLFLTRTLAGADVTLLLPERAGEVVVRAPSATWDLNAGLIVLPKGGSARNGSGWSADVPAAQVSLPIGVLTAGGKVSLSGPGVSVAGDNLVWRFRDGTLSLEVPMTRFEPRRVPYKRG